MTDFVERPPRMWNAAVEQISTACGRLVLRELVDGLQRYQLWEPIIGDSQYHTTAEIAGQQWGLARTRRSSAVLPASVLARADAAIGHAMLEARRAMDLLRRTVPELALRDPQGRYAGVTEGIFESRGDILLMGTPQVVAQRATQRRRSRTK